MNAKYAGLIGGVAMLAACLVFPPPAGLSTAGWQVLGVTALMSIWWSTEAVPIVVTAGAPFLLLPLLGVAKADAVAASYMAPGIFLVLGGTMLGLAVERWRLHQRIARAILTRVGGRPETLVLGVLVTTTLISSFVSNVAAMLIVLPVPIALIAMMEQAAPEAAADRRAFNAAIVLATTYGAMIGGFATIVGTPVNPVLAAMIEKTFGIHLGFVGWAMFGIPLAVLATPLAWLILTRLAFRFDLPRLDEDVLAGAFGERRPWNSGEVRTTVVGLLTAAAWVTAPIYQPWAPQLSDAAISVLAMLALCVIPAGAPLDDNPAPRLLDWPDLRAAPWHILFLFGGGLALAGGIGGTDLGAWLAEGVRGVTALPTFAMLLLFALCLVAITEWMSNFAMFAAFMPVAAVLGGGDPELGLALGMVVALASNWSFMMPVATIPNALAMGTGHVRAPQMIRAGAIADVTGAVLIAIIAALCSRLFGLLL